MNSELFKQEYMGNPQVINDEILLFELAKEYLERTEAFDNSICSGISDIGGSIPINKYENKLIFNNSENIKKEIYEKAALKGIDKIRVRKAISYYSSRQSTFM